MRKTVFALALATSALAAAACSAEVTPQAAAQANAAASAQIQNDPGAPPPMRAHRGMHGGAMMMRADANEDGVITRAEAIAQADARFDRLDTNHDGKVTSDEQDAMRSAMRERMGARRKSPPQGDPQGAMARKGRHHDRDGAMTKADAEARAVKRFDRMDANHDGKLDKTELANVKELRHLKHDKMQGGDMPPPPPTGTD
ncbi:MAG: hypothetical protein M3R64_12890 [Pseudomonadota bacterium]|nr:hypothetical protein [Pseudomonadota bacterium]